MEKEQQPKSKGGGFLPKTFSLTPDEISKIRIEQEGKDNSHPEVRAEVRKIWCSQRRKHKRRARLVALTARAFNAELG